MKQKTYETMCKRMKAQGITLSSLTKEVNKTTHVCEQEMINYMLVPEEMPDAKRYKWSMKESGEYAMAILRETKEYIDGMLEEW